LAHFVVAERSNPDAPDRIAVQAVLFNLDMIQAGGL
jgi:hypothetical protein